MHVFVAIAWTFKSVIIVYVSGIKHYTLKNLKVFGMGSSRFSKSDVKRSPLLNH